MQAVQKQKRSMQWKREEAGAESALFALWTEIWAPWQAAALLLLIDAAESNYQQVFMTAAKPMPAPHTHSYTYTHTHQSYYYILSPNTPESGFIENYPYWTDKKVHIQTITEENLGWHNSKSAQ